MKIIELNRLSGKKAIEDLNLMLIEQMKEINIDIDNEKIQKAINNAMKINSKAYFFILYTDENKPVGLCFFNVSSGIESGGDYIWLNELHIKKEYRKMGYGDYLLKFLNDWAKNNRCVNIVCITSTKNEASQKLFKNNDFALHNVVWAEKNIK